MEESEESDDEPPAKKKDDGRRTSRRVSKPSRKNSLELEEPRRGSKKFVEESAADRRASKRSMDAFNTSMQLSALIDDVIKHKHAWPFTKPVSANEVPDYFEVIKRPMDFGKIKSKLNLGDYRINEQALKDIELVFFNCDLYNNASSEIYQ